MALSRVKVFSLSSYLEAALKLAGYDRDEDGVVIATVPSASGLFAQGETPEEARANLEDVIERNALLALQLGWEVPMIPGVDIKERDVETDSAPR